MFSRPVTAIGVPAHGGHQLFVGAIERVGAPFANSDGAAGPTWPPAALATGRRQKVDLELDGEDSRFFWHQGRPA